MKVLNDTNIVIDALTSREPWTNMLKIFLMAANSVIDMYITARACLKNHSRDLHSPLCG